ncbi:hypothetical protein HPP92_004013 [Vanilla planifolia]|uniref:Uncharacterized protein n=1 Tax=Vanilla planifolia TaxID=51239 RepID=A0A835S9G2_VANPL|nr:hypothetical protein HPP92_004013 [Vanilla planifolia]
MGRSLEMASIPVAISVSVLTHCRRWDRKSGRREAAGRHYSARICYTGGTSGINGSYVLQLRT